MNDHTSMPTARFEWGIAASIILHLLLLLPFVIHLKPRPPEPAKDESIKVELVKPEPEPQPEPKPQPEVQPKPEPKPEPMQPVEKPVEPQKPAPAAAPQAFESAATQTEKPQPEAAELPPTTPDKPDQSPVTPPAANNADDHRPAADTKPAEEATAQDQQLTAAETAGTLPLNAVPVPQQRPRSAPQDSGAAAQGAATGNDGLPSPQLRQAKAIFSKSILADPRVKQAIGQLPLNQRIRQICMIEMGEQIRHSRSGITPDLLSQEQEREQLSGSTLTAPENAVRSRGRWYPVSYKCTVNAAGNSVETFSYDIGPAMPEAERARRGLKLN